MTYLGGGHTGLIDGKLAGGLVVVINSHSLQNLDNSERNVSIGSGYYIEKVTLWAHLQALDSLRAVLGLLARCKVLRHGGQALAPLVPRRHGREPGKSIGRQDGAQVELGKGEEIGVAWLITCSNASKASAITSTWRLTNPAWWHQPG